MAGDIDLQDVIEYMRKNIKETQGCLAEGNSLVRVESNSCNIMNFVHCGATGILLTFACSRSPSR